MSSIICAQCKQQMPAHLKRQKKRRFCSMDCYYEMRRSLLGAKNPNWKGGYIRTDGYKCIGIGKRKYYEHRLVAEKMLGRPLKNGDIIHHIDGNKSNNAASNLRILTQNEHAKLHRPKTGKFFIGLQSATT